MSSTFHIHLRFFHHWSLCQPGYQRCPAHFIIIIQSFILGSSVSLVFRDILQISYSSYSLLFLVALLARLSVISCTFHIYLTAFHPWQLCQPGFQRYPIHFIIILQSFIIGSSVSQASEMSSKFYIHLIVFQPWLLCLPGYSGCSVQFCPQKKLTITPSPYSCSLQVLLNLSSGWSITSWQLFLMV